jgi:diguanylate cyclase (GGDEF)-like protein
MGRLSPILHDVALFGLISAGLVSAAVLADASERVHAAMDGLEFLELDEFILSLALMAVAALIVLGHRAIELQRARNGRAEDEAEIWRLAHYDGLTGLANRSLFRDRLEHDIARAGRSGETIAVLCLDLDRFKEVNDLYGHGVGDALLREVAARLREGARNQDTTARLGGDEFALVMPGIGSAEAAVATAERLIERLSGAYEDKAFNAVIGASIGIALFPDDGTTAEDLVRRADMALYRAKMDGRGRACLFAPEMDRILRERRVLELELQAALRHGRELTLHYQPQFDLGSRRLVAFEALLRWNHPQRGPIPPASFIPLAEQTGLIVPLGAWVLGRACRDAVCWPAGIVVSVNMSPAQFKQANLVETVADELAASGLAPDRLELEITETVLLQDTEATLEKLRQLKDLGVRIAMDDFGTGYSSLGYLRQFPFDKLKIDRSFTGDLGQQPEAAAIVEAALGLGRSLHMTTTAEGVETQAQLEQLSAMGCGQVQGFLCGRPMAHDSVLTALADQKVGLRLDGWADLGPATAPLPAAPPVPERQAG